MQYFCNVSAAALRTSLRVSDPGFGARLRAIEDEHQKSCDTDVGESPGESSFRRGLPPKHA